MSFLVLSRKVGESLLMYSDENTLQLTVRQISGERIKISYLSSCDLDVISQNNVVKISRDQQTIVSHSSRDFKISGLLDDQKNPLSVGCSLKFKEAGSVKMAIDAPYSVEIIRDEIESKKVVA